MRAGCSPWRARYGPGVTTNRWPRGAVGRRRGRRSGDRLAAWTHRAAEHATIGWRSWVTPTPISGCWPSSPASTRSTCTRPTAPAALSGWVRVAAWNVQRGRRPAALAAALRAAGAELCLLSELDAGMARTQNLDTTGCIARDLGAGSVFGVEFVELGLGDEQEQRAVAGAHQRAWPPRQRRHRGRTARGPRGGAPARCRPGLVRGRLDPAPGGRAHGRARHRARRRHRRPDRVDPPREPHRRRAPRRADGGAVARRG